VQVALAADTVSMLVMEIVDNGVILAVPGAMDAGVGSPVFWASLAGALAVAFGHAADQPLADAPGQGARRRLRAALTPVVSTPGRQRTPTSGRRSRSCAPGAAAERRRNRQRAEKLPVPASVRSSSCIAGVFARAMARSNARRVRAACRRCLQLDVTVLISTASFIEVDRCALSKAGRLQSIPTNQR
jgi:hypothetical protein